MTTDIPQLRTVGVIADELGESLSRVTYILRKHNVKPIGRAGCIRLFDRGAVEAVRAAIAAQDKREAVPA